MVEKRGALQRLGCSSWTALSWLALSACLGCSDGADAYLDDLQTRQITYATVHHEIADGNFVFVLSEGAVAGTAVAHYDLFRVEGDRIVEHWNARRDVPATTQSGLGIF